MKNFIKSPIFPDRSEVQDTSQLSSHYATLQGYPSKTITDQSISDINPIKSVLTQNLELITKKPKIEEQKLELYHKKEFDNGLSKVKVNGENPVN